MGIRKESPEWVGRNTPTARRTYPINQEAESFLRLLSLFDLTTLRLHEPARATTDMPGRTPPNGAPGSKSPIPPQQEGADAAREDEQAAEERDNIITARAARERVHRKPVFYGSADKDHPTATQRLAQMRNPTANSNMAAELSAVQFLRDHLVQMTRDDLRTDTDKIDSTVKALRGEAEAWWWNLPPDGRVFATWADFRARFLDHFQTSHSTPGHAARSGRE
jgi:hypothetical protein